MSCGDGAEVETDEDTGAGTITIATTGTPDGGETINLMGTRVDVSSLDAGDEIIATISTTAPTGLIPIGQSRRGSVAAVVAEVKAGLTVGISAASRLICNLDATEDADNDAATAETPVGGVPTITVTEGFNDAWEAGDGALGGTSIAIVTMNLPEGVELRFPESVTFLNPGDENNNVWATLTLSGDAATEAVVGETSDEANDGSMVTYDYTQQEPGDSNGVMDSFAIPITVVTGDIDAGGGGIADIWGVLSPQPADDDANVATVLSYLKDRGDRSRRPTMGDFLNIAECVTYLLFPYITCGAHADWDTGIAIANTTMDDGIFGLSTGATAQRGAVTMYAFPTGTKSEGDNATEMGYMGKPTMAMLSGGLAAGDSLAMNLQRQRDVGWNAGLCHRQGRLPPCSRNGLRARISASGAIDAVHGYVALVIPDPEFGGDERQDRAAAEGEVLGH